MTKTLTTLAALAALIPATLMAQEAMDTNADGMVSLDELQVVYPQVDGDTFMQADTDGDALLTMDELAAAQEAGLLPMQDG